MNENKKTKRILFLLPYLKAGGTERQLYYLTRELKDEYCVEVCIVEDTGSFKHFFRDIDLKIINTKFSKNNALKIIYKLRQILVRGDYDLVVSRGWNTNMIVSLASLNLKVKTMLYISGSVSGEKNYFEKTFRSWLFNRANKMISVSKEAKENCIKSYQNNPGNVQVIHNGVDLDLIKNSTINQNNVLKENNKFTLLFVGRLEYRKGLDYLLCALEKIPFQIRKNMELLVVGEGTKLSHYKKLAESLNLMEQVFFLGEKTNPFPYMRLADIFLFPSRSEGFPNVLLEAMALGMPVISSNCQTGPSEVIRQMENGILIEIVGVEEEKVSQAFADKIVLLFQEEELREKIGLQAKKDIENNFKLEDKIKEVKTSINTII
ncbi:glycosyltransferase [Bacillus sp. FJAT-44742]|uniref:glycosyltransferase n=1 Tax=Bacillus sp. FJAT-44742 TaxID=2014005 RepID=UPI0018E2194E|nr:glycosyltransferase [Bacillus sp. FJAT-44742]